MQVPPTDRIAAFRPLGAEQLSLAALSPAVATVRPQPVAEVDTNGPDGEATDRERADTESLVRLFAVQSEEATYERQIQRAQREQAQALERRLESISTDPGLVAGNASAAGAAAQSGGAATAPTTDSNASSSARERGLQAASDARRTGDPVRPPRSTDAEPSPPGTSRLDNGAPVQTTPSSEPLPVSRGPRPIDAAAAFTSI